MTSPVQMILNLAMRAGSETKNLRTELANKSSTVTLPAGSTTIPAGTQPNSLVIRKKPVA